jgi:hypothetical protein
MYSCFSREHLRQKKVKIPGFRKGVVEEGRFEIAKTIVECLKSNRWDGALAR